MSKIKVEKSMLPMFCVLCLCSLFSVLRTKFHPGQVGQCPTCSVLGRNGCNLRAAIFFSYESDTFSTMSKENIIEKGRRLAKYWTGKSL